MIGTILSLMLAMTISVLLSPEIMAPPCKVGLMVIVTMATYEPIEPYELNFKLNLHTYIRHTIIVGIKVFDQNIDFKKPNAKFCYLQKYVKSVKTTPKFLAAKELFYLFIYSNIFLTLVSSGKTGN